MLEYVESEHGVSFEGMARDGSGESTGEGAKGVMGEGEGG
jgi:hypothetical protein